MARPTSDWEDNPTMLGYVPQGSPLSIWMESRGEWELSADRLSLAFSWSGPPADHWRSFDFAAHAIIFNLMALDLGAPDHRAIALDAAMRVFGDGLRFRGSVVEISCLDSESLDLVQGNRERVLKAIAGPQSGERHHLIVHSVAAAAAHGVHGTGHALDTTVRNRV